MDVETLLSVLGLLLGGGGIGTFFTWKWNKRKEKAEATQAEAEAEKAKVEISQATAEMMKTIQDGYQQMIGDMKANLDEQKQYNEEQKQYIAEIKEDRMHLRRERDELRARIDRTDETVRNLQSMVARNGRQIEMMKPFLCYDQKCKKRQVAAITDGEMSEARQKDIEPLPMKDL